MLLNLLEFKCNHFYSLFQAESEFKKIQILEGNPVKSCLSAGSQISSTLV